MNNKTIHNLHLYSLSLALIGLLFPIKFSSICVVIFGLFSIIRLFKIKKKFNKNLLLFSGFYFLYLIGLLFTENIKFSQGLLERNLTWLLAPFLIYFTISITKKERFNILFLFSVATFLFGVFYLFQGIYNYFLEGNSSVFYNTSLTSFTGFHPVYFSSYTLFSFIILLHGFKEKYIKKSILKQSILWSFTTLILILLSSKTILFVFLIFSIFYIGKYLQTLKKLFLLPFFIIGFIILIFSFATTKDRINDSIFSKWELLQKDQFLYNDAFTGITLRLITWKFVAKKFFKEENVFLGTGTGDGQDFIDSVYKEHKMDTGGYLGFNMHNQYLEYLIKFGFIGLLFFITIVFLFLKKAIQNKDALYLWFLIIFLSFSFTESTLEVHRGIVFFTLFNFFLYYNSYNSKIVSNT